MSLAFDMNKDDKTWSRNFFIKIVVEKTIRNSGENVKS